MAYFDISKQERSFIACYYLRKAIYILLTVGYNWKLNFTAKHFNTQFLNLENYFTLTTDFKINNNNNCMVLYFFKLQLQLPDGNKYVAVVLSVLFEKYTMNFRWITRMVIKDHKEVRCAIFPSYQIIVGWKK